jgi:dimethylamine monooxygenase subunit A
MDLPPFLQGPPRFDVALRPIGLDRWLFPDDQAHWLAEKARLINGQCDAVFVASPASLSAQGEAAALIAHAGNATLSSHDAPLLAAARLVSDDLVIMEHVDGQWTNSACCLCNPTFFSAHFAYGKSLEVLHGPVPDGDFGLATDTILERHNWTVQWSDARYTPDGTPLRDAAAIADIAQANDHLFLRVERQTIRKLPQSGAVLFTIRIRLTKLTDVLADAHHKAAFQKSWVEAPHNVRAYKKWGVLERHVGAVLGL